MLELTIIDVVVEMNHSLKYLNYRFWLELAVLDEQMSMRSVFNPILMLSFHIAL